MAKETTPMKDPQDKTLEERMLDFQERQLRIQEAQVKVQEQQLKQTEAKSKTAPALVSAFNPQGQKDYPIPALKCEVWMPWQQTPALHGFDYEEVELLNRLEPGSYDVELNNGDIEHVAVVGVTNRVSQKLERMTFTRGWDEDAKCYTALFTHENRQYFPSLKNMLRQMLRGQPGMAEAGEAAPEILTMKERVRRTTLPEGDPRKLPMSVSA